MAAQTESPAISFNGYAGFWKRVAASIIDSLILGIGGFMIGGILGFILGVVLAIQGYDTGSIEKIAGVAGFILGLILNWLYFTILESSNWQATPGKMALGIKVTDYAYDRISFARATGRYFAKFISTIILLIGFFMAGFTEKKQALHDLIANTLVVNK